MALVPVTAPRFAGARWKRFTGYGFAAGLTLAPLGLSELAASNGQYPLVFVRQGERYQCMALLSLRPPVNAFLAPDGQWLGRYTPAALRAYPFQLMVSPGQDGQPPQWSLAYLEESGLISFEPDAAGEAVLTLEGEPSPALRGVTDFLIARQNAYANMQRAVDALAGAGLIEPWPDVPHLDPAQPPLPGLFRVNAKALDALPNEGFCQLRANGALTLAILQLASGQQVEGLAQTHRLMDRVNAQRAQTPPAAAPARPAANPMQGINMRIEDGQFRFD